MQNSKAFPSPAEGCALSSLFSASLSGTLHHSQVYGVQFGEQHLAKHLTRALIIRHVTTVNGLLLGWRIKFFLSASVCLWRATLTSLLHVFSLSFPVRVLESDVRYFIIVFLATCTWHLIQRYILVLLCCLFFSLRPHLHACLVPLVQWSDIIDAFSDHTSPSRFYPVLMIFTFKDLFKTHKGFSNHVCFSTLWDERHLCI